MILNRKGFILEGAAVLWVTISLIIGTVAIFKGPDIVKSLGSVWNGGDKNQTKQTYELSERYPVGTMDAQGKFIKMGDYDKKEKRLNLVAVQPPLTFWQKYGWVFLLLGIAIIACPSFGIWIYNKARNNIAQLITGIEEAKKQMPKASADILSANLSRKMDASVKTKIKKIKGQLVAKGVLTTAAETAPTT